MIDFALLAAYAVILGATHSKDGLLMLLSFGASMLYTQSGMFDAHPAWANHLIVSVVFFPAILLTAKWVSITTICYAIFQWLTAGEYIFFKTSEFLIGPFAEIAASLNLLIMVAIVHERYNHNYIKNSLMADSWIINICIRHSQISSKEKGGHA